MVTPRDVQLLSRKWGSVHVVLIERSDSAFWRADAERTEQFIASLRSQPLLIVEKRVSPTMAIRVWRVDADSTPTPAGEAEATEKLRRRLHRELEDPNA